jgi:hypothetical protein
LERGGSELDGKDGQDGVTERGHGPSLEEIQERSRPGLFPPLDGP